MITVEDILELKAKGVTAIRLKRDAFNALLAECAERAKHLIGYSPEYGEKQVPIIEFSIGGVYIKLDSEWKHSNIWEQALFNPNPPMQIENLEDME